jgi:phosphoglycerate dehydrogenase-like enzyme
MNILVTLQEGTTRNIFFPEAAMQEIYKLGNVKLNETGRAFSEEVLAEQIRGIDICITHWGCPKFTEQVLKNADRLKMVAHAAGSVANHITDAVYEKGIKVSSSNDIMAKYVAEGTLAFILAALRLIPRHVNDMKNKLLWERDLVGSKSLFGKMKFMKIRVGD